MAKFNFRLQSVLKLRQSERQSRQMELSVAYHSQQEHERSVEQLSAEIEQIKGQLREESKPGKLHIDSLLNQRRYESDLQSKQRELRIEGERIEQEIAQRRSSLVEADKQVSILENLQNRLQRQHYENQLVREAIELDEIASRVATSAQDNLAR